MNNPRQIPNEIPDIYIVTGFLGAGKTTLINNILKKYNQTHISIIENEFGEAQVDSIILNKDNTNIIEISNGCICCSEPNEILITIDRVLNLYPKTQIILLETTGIADANKLAAQILGNDQQTAVNFRGTICIIDAIYINAILNEVPVATKQITFADLILINKTDKITLEQIVDIRKRVELINPFAYIYETIYSDISQIEIFDIQVQNKLNKLMDSIIKSNGINHGFNQLLIHLKTNIDEEDFNYSINSLLRNNPNIFRAKGIVTFTNGETNLVQSVMNSFTLSPISLDANSQKDFLIVIGQDLNSEKLIEYLSEIIVL